MKVLYQRGSTTPTLQHPNEKYSQKEEDETAGGHTTHTQKDARPHTALVVQSKVDLLQ
jgi:hypothetical protein